MRSQVRDDLGRRRIDVLMERPHLLPVDESPRLFQRCQPPVDQPCNRPRSLCPGNSGLDHLAERCLALSFFHHQRRQLLHPDCRFALSGRPRCAWPRGPVDMMQNLIFRPTLRPSAAPLRRHCGHDAARSWRQPFEKLMILMPLHGTGISVVASAARWCRRYGMATRSSRKRWNTSGRTTEVIEMSS